MAKADDIKARIGLSDPTLQRIEGAPPSVPDHELVRRIGQGSYGEVWLARNAVGTWRAVKVVYRNNFKDARPYDREFSGIQKYEPISRTNEGLVDVLQIGRNDAEGYFYYVMELADDANPPTVAADVRRLTSVTIAGGDQSLLTSAATYTPKTLSSEIQKRGRLPLEECIPLGMTLNLALGHLHRHGLIHRDVKPSNIIFVNGVPKLADIGLVTDSAEAQSFVGTEGFIPPEGPGTRQADLYALGKVLYEASMGKDRQEFPEPFTHLGLDAESKALMELNAVLLKACAANPKQRYQTAEEMNADLALLYSGKSVKDKHALERRLKTTRRVAVAVIAIMVLGVVPYYLAIKEARRAVVGEQAAKRESARSQQVSSFLQNLLRGVDPAFARGRDTTVLNEILRLAGERIAKELKDQPEVQAQLCLTIGVTYWKLGELTNAAAMMREAVQLRRSVLGPQHQSVANALANLGGILDDASDSRGAEAAEREAIAIQRRLVGNERTNLATTLNNLGLALQHQGKLAQAEEAGQEALTIRKQILGENSPDIIMSTINLGLLQFQRGEFNRAETNFVAALALARKLVPEDDPYISVLENNRAEIMKNRGDLEEAEALYRITLEARKKIYPIGHQHVAFSHNQLASVLAAQGRLEEAESSVRDAQAVEEKMHLGSHEYVADTLTVSALIKEMRGDLPAAEVYYKRTLAMRKELGGEDGLGAVEASRSLALLEAVRGDPIAAEEKLNYVLKIAGKIQGDHNLNLVATRRQFL